jgi:hypothetical protein
MALAPRRPYGMYRWLANMPRRFYLLGLRWVFGHRVAQITQRGRRSGQIRRTILEVLHYDPHTISQSVVERMVVALVFISSTPPVFPQAPTDVAKLSAGMRPPRAPSLAEDEH